MSYGGQETGRRVTMSGKRALLEQLLVDNVTCIFGNPGTTEQGFMDQLQDYPSIAFYLALHEGVAVAMADAYARATRKPAFVELHIAPGLGNAMGMLGNAHRGHSPLVVYVGQSPSTGIFQEPMLTADLVTMARPLTKWAAEITSPADIPQALRRAFKVAEEPPQGPVLLSLPLDVLDAEAEMLVRPTTYVSWHVPPPQGAVEEAAATLIGARAPVIAVGDQVALSDGQSAVVALAEVLGAPVLTTTNSNTVNMPAGHPLYQGRSIPVHSAPLRRTLEAYDVLLAIGTPLFPSIFPEPEGPIPDGMRVIHVDYDSWELGKNHAGGLLIHADPRETILALTEEVLRRADPATRQRWEQRRSAIERATLDRREALRRTHERTWDAVPIAPHRLMAEIAAALPENAVIYDESITSGGSLDLYLPPGDPRPRFRSRGGAIGGGLPGTLGLQVAFPDRPVVGVLSDGASMYSITALWTAAHHRLPITCVICNNRSYRILKQNLRDYRAPEDAGRPFPYMDLTDPELRFDRIAEALGVRGVRIERPEEIGSALRDAIDSGEPRLLDVVLDNQL